MRIQVLLAGMVVPLVVSAAGATIEVSTPDIGFRADTVSRVYRSGAFLPVGVDVLMTAGEPVPVYLRIAQHDRDGDVVHSELFATLSPDPDGGVRRYWLYYIPNPDTSLRDQGLEFQILHAETGEAVEFVFENTVIRRLEIPDNLERINDAEYFMLVLSEDTAGPLMGLSDLTRPEGPRFHRPLRVANLSARGLPDHWHGLETVDAIVWDAAQPTVLSPNQLDALFDWIGYGGHLLLTGSTTADTILQEGTFGDYIPATRSGLETVTEVPNRLFKGQWDRRYFDESAGEEEITVEYAAPIPVALCTPTADTARRIARRGSDRVYAVSQAHGLGRVSYMAATIRDLFVDADEEQLADFVRSMFALRKFAGNNDASAWSRLGAPVPLFDYLKVPISFSESLIIYVFIVIVFVAFYAVGSTWGTWAVLRARRRLTYCWPVFAVVAAAASFVSYGAVRGMQGIGYELHQMSIVDTTPGTYSATAKCYFGIKTSSMARLDFWLPSDDQTGEAPQWTRGYLRPLSPIIGASIQQQAHFADTKSYGMRPSFAELRGVPVRATLRQLEGYWHGTMDGQITATINVRKRASLKETIVAPDSVVTNQLGHDLYRCLLIEARLEADRQSQSRAPAMLIHDLGALADGDTMDLAAAIDNALADSSREEALDEFQATAARSISSALPGRPASGLDDFENTVMLLTTFREYDALPTSNQNVYIPLVPENCRWLDRSLHIEPDQFLFIGFAEGPGPAQLHAREDDDPYEPLRPEGRMSTTVYRVAIPARRQ